MTLGFQIPGGTLSSVGGDGFHGTWVRLARAALDAGACIVVEGARRWVALQRYIPWWPRPVFGAGNQVPAGEYFLVLAEADDGRCAVILPLVDGDLRVVLRGEAGGWSLHPAARDPLPDEPCVAFVASGEDPVELIRWAVARIAERMGTFRLREDKPDPHWVDLFGWCTWDAFYEKVDGEKVLSGLRTFRDGGLVPGVLILDGGWQPVEDEQLLSFSAEGSRFPDGLAPVISRAKQEFGVRIFGAWHTLQGYWNGVHPKGELGDRYRLIQTESEAYNLEGFKHRSLVHPVDVGRFFDDYHRALRGEGVDMVKVDNQAALDHFAADGVAPTYLMSAYQRALQDSVENNFEGESLYCMSHSTDLAYSLDRAVAWRSSQDFFPDRPETHGWHVFDNAINSLWSHTYGLCDWDMFQSGHPAGAFHAAARAISGGPVYVSDKPGTQDFALLRKLVLSDGTVLRCAQPALPSRDTIFEDGRSIPRVTKVVNHNDVAGLASPIGVLGLFNCHYDEGGSVLVRGTFRATDVRGIGDGPHALYRHLSREVLVDQGDVPIELRGLGFELVTVSPIVEGIAVFGLIDKLNGSRAVRRVEYAGDGKVRVVLADGGQFGWYSESGVANVFVGDEAVAHNADGALSWADIPVGGEATVTLQFTVGQPRVGHADAPPPQRVDPRMEADPSEQERSGGSPSPRER